MDKAANEDGRPGGGGGGEAGALEKYYVYDDLSGVCSNDPDLAWYFVDRDPPKCENRGFGIREPAKMRCDRDKVEKLKIPIFFFKKATPVPFCKPGGRSPHATSN